MFIYYSILGFAIFGLLWLFLHWCDNFESDKQLACYCLPKDHTITLIFLGSTIFVFLGLVVTITCYFVFIPINKSISDAPNRVISIYQSGGFIVGSVIVYKILEFFYIKKKKEITIEDIHKILNKRLPCPVQQQKKSQKFPESARDKQETSQKSPEGVVRDEQQAEPGAGAPKHSTQQGEHQGQIGIPLRPSAGETTDVEISTAHVTSTKL
jgi:hypothetical protein